MHNPQEYEVSRILIRRYLDEDQDDVVEVTAEDLDGEPLPLIESLGLLALAQAHLTAEMIRDTPPED